jgi:hypothetical protein
LFGAQIAAESSGVLAWQTTQGVGATFASQTFHVTSAGNYDLTLSDLGYPANFSLIGAILTRGFSTLGQVYGGDTVKFAATPGDYTVNILSQVGSGSDYGSYGLLIQNAPAPPTVTLHASSSNVTSGQPVTLTWASVGATGCTASGGWSGAQSTSGTYATAALTANTTFALACVASDGQSDQTSVSVQVNPAPKSSGGGGGFLVLDLLVLGAAALQRSASMSMFKRSAMPVK